MFDVIELKTGSSRDELAGAGFLRWWEEKFASFKAGLRKTAFGAVIMDFDGTVYAGGQPYGVVLDDALAHVLTGLLEAGLILGFASGRGESLRLALRQTFPPALWPRIYAAYQDGAETGRLDDDSLPHAYDPGLEDPALAQAREHLQSIFSHWPNAPQARKENQLLGFRCDHNAEAVFAACCSVALPLGLKCFRSARMVDVATAGVSKRNLAKLRPLRQHGILAIGDAGSWPGNDCELLADACGISVGSVSPDPDCCWRLDEEEGPAATLKILRSLVPCRDAFILNWK